MVKFHSYLFFGAHTAAALAAYGFIADLVPAQYTAAALAAVRAELGR